MNRITPVLIVPLLFAAATAIPGTDPVAIDEWPVPWENSRPRDPYVAPDGRVWFVGQRGNYVAYLVPETGEFKRYELDPGVFPHNLIVDRDGSVWYAGNRAGHIGKLDPATGKVTKYPMPDPEARDPHTLVFDESGHIWFTLQGSNMVGRLTKATGKIELLRVPTPRARPYGIALDSNGRPWVNLLGANKLVTIDPATMQLREIPLPREDGSSRRIAITSDDAIWYVDYHQGYLGRYIPESGEFREWRIPGGAEGRPYAMAVDDRDRLWFVETGPKPNRLVGFDPATAEFFSMTEIPSGGGAIRHMFFHAPTGMLWFGTDTNTIGRAKVSAGGMVQTDR
ncbi:MAG TPA: hypothetical protein VF188_11365 [Longimicrobiales bacterium]